MNLFRKTVALACLCLLALTWPAQAGQLKITSPTPTSPEPKAGVTLQYAISKWKSQNTGVTFNATATPQHGSVVGWQWKFGPGTLMDGSTSAQTQSPGPVKYPDSAYGNSNPATVGVKHTVPGESTPCTDTDKTIATVNVNVVKPKLVFKTSGNWASDNTAATRLNSDYH